MRIESEYQKLQFDAIHGLFDELNKSSKTKYTMNDVVIKWLTEGYAESLRKEYLKNHETHTS